MIAAYKADQKFEFTLDRLTVQLEQAQRQVGWVQRSLADARSDAIRAEIELTELREESQPSIWDSPMLWYGLGALTGIMVVVVAGFAIGSAADGV